MMVTERGLSFTCKEYGEIESILSNTLNPEINKFQGKLFTELFRIESVTRALDFLLELKRKTAAFGWELSLKPVYCEKPLFFSGAMVNGYLVIIAHESVFGSREVLSELMLINNEQTNLIRHFEKEKKDATLSETLDFLEELSKMNNELVQLQRELSKKNSELDDIIQIKNRFFGIAAHDLRNPLGNIISYCEFIEEEPGNLSEEQEEFLCHIKSMASSMVKLVSDLLDYSSIESGKVKLTLEKFDMISFLKDILHLNRTIAERKKIKVNFLSNEKECNIIADKGKIEQVISNLYTNAVKYSFPDSQIHINVKISENEFLLSIKDEGQGIADAELDLLFRPFQKTSSKTTAGETSTGLGLYIVKRIVDAHGGKIWVESELGNGTTFYLALSTESN